MTLTDLLPDIQKLSLSEKIKLIRILTEELDSNTSIYPLEANKSYDLPTPYNNFGAGEVLMKLIKTSEQEEKQ